MKRKSILPITVVFLVATSLYCCILQGREKVGKVEDRELSGPFGKIPLRIFAPSGEGPFPILVYIHGGGWVLGGIRVTDKVCRAFTNRLNCITISVDYHLAPAYKFPVPVEDVYTVITWTFHNANRLRGDTTRIAVGGISAGANLAAAVCLMARDRGGPPLVFQVLSYPPTNLSTMDTESYRKYASGYGLTKKQVEWFRKQYLRSMQDSVNPYVSPLLADNLHNLPPALIFTGEFDVLRDEGEAYCSRLQEAGVNAKLVRFPGKGHGDVQWKALSENGHTALQEACTALSAAFAK